MIKSAFVFLALSALSGAAGLAQTDAGSSDRPWMNPALPPDQRAMLVVSRMTLDEKVQQIHLTATHDHPREIPAIPRLGVPKFSETNGPCGAGPGDTHVAEPATAMPAALALAASWDPRLATLYGSVVGREVADLGEDLLEGPGMNIARVPENGRNFEYFGEDPYLAGRMAVAEIGGIQGQGVIAQMKHFAVNSQEHDRKTIDELVDDRSLHEIYLPAFEASVTEGHVGAVMAAYPAVNGHFCCENPYLLDDILRGQWGFNGFVESDYTATKNAVRSGRAGLDLAMRPDHYAAEMKQAVLDGQVPESYLDQLVLHRYAVMFRFGMFDHPRTTRPIPAREDGSAARRIADQTAVLLKNEGGLLPLDPTRVRTIAVIGPYAGAAMTGGSGSSKVRPLYTVSPVDGIRRRAGDGVKIVYNDGSDPTAAAAAARSADAVLLMVGDRDSEGRDRPNLELPHGQDALVAAVAAANPKTVVVLKTGGAVLMPWIDQVPAILEVWYPGEEDGDMVADLVFGDVNPSGKLPLTYPRAENQVPASTPEQYPGIGGTAVYTEKLLVGYRWYDAMNQDPLFPFGFGLSYTTFSVSGLAVSAPAADGTVRVSADVSNTGRRRGADVVQVYVQDPAEAGEPPHQLKGFQKVELAPGQTQRVTLTLGPRAFSVWDTARQRWTLPAGAYEIRVGDSSRNLPLSTSITQS